MVCGERSKKIILRVTVVLPKDFLADLNWSEKSLLPRGRQLGKISEVG